MFRVREKSYYDGDIDTVASLTKQHFGSAKPGYRDGVLEVPVPPDGFYTSIVEIEPGTEVVGVFGSRREGELPYMQITLPPGQENNMPAKSVNIILYARETLEESGDETTGADWDVISINASPAEPGEQEPIKPETLMRNYFMEPGGTEMKGTSPEQFVQMLRQSREYWRNKIQI